MRVHALDWPAMPLKCFWQLSCTFEEMELDKILVRIDGISNLQSDLSFYSALNKMIQFWLVESTTINFKLYSVGIPLVSMAMVHEHSQWRANLNVNRKEANTHLQFSMTWLKRKNKQRSHTHRKETHKPVMFGIAGLKSAISILTLKKSWPIIFLSAL